MLLKMINLLRRLSTIMCLGAGFLIIILTLTNVYAVIMRYFINSPIDWSLEISELLLVSMVFLGTAYTLLDDGHVKISLFTNRMPKKVQTACELIGNCIICLFCLTLTWKSWELAWINFNVTSASFARIPLFPGYIIIPIGTFILLLQSLAQIIMVVTHAAKNPQALSEES